MISINLEGQVAVLTGGSRGIGAATVKLLAQAGAKVAFTYMSQRAVADKLIAECPRASTFALQADAAEPSSADRLVAAAVESFGALHIAISNAGEWPSDDVSITDIDPERWRRIIDVNLTGTYALARAAVRQIQRQQRSPNGVAGRIICVASTAGQRGEAWHSDYGAAKGGIIALVRGLAPELAADRILINCIAPGWVATDMAADAMKTRGQQILQKIPLGRIAQPEEIAGCILFLCSRWSEFMTGSVLSVNGGAVLA